MRKSYRTVEKLIDELRLTLEGPTFTLDYPLDHSLGNTLRFAKHNDFSMYNWVEKGDISVASVDSNFLGMYHIDEPEMFIGYSIHPGTMLYILVSDQELAGHTWRLKKN